MKKKKKEEQKKGIVVVCMRARPCAILDRPIRASLIEKDERSKEKGDEGTKHEDVGGGVGVKSISSRGNVPKVLDLISCCFEQ